MAKRLWDVADIDAPVNFPAGTAVAALARDSCLMQSAPAEPVFVLCARDPCAIVAIDIWLHERRAALRELEDRYEQSMSAYEKRSGHQPEDDAWRANIHDLHQRLVRERAKLAEAAQVAGAFLAWPLREGA